ncbi:CHC2 zinc finger domain-containing protein [Streptosporangium canum]|uniref:CHC2 zinc finger domain-containing protein n=1 Tax=Streptosporangium canum TaxID=324952 RepID=UPI00369617A5
MTSTGNPTTSPPMTDHQIAVIREHSPIADLVRDCVELTDAGDGSLKGLCPFHDETIPSFFVTPARGYWYCFGCSKGGDVIAFVRKLNDLSFHEALTALAERAGVQFSHEEAGR